MRWLALAAAALAAVGCSAPVPTTAAAHLEPAALAAPGPRSEPIRGTLVRTEDGSVVLWCEDPLWGEDEATATIRDADRIDPDLRVRIEDDVVWIGYPRQPGRIPAIDAAGRLVPLTTNQVADLEVLERDGRWEPWD